MIGGTAWEGFLAVAHAPDAEIDLARAALLIAASEYHALDVDGQLRILDSLADGLAPRLGAERDPLFCARALSRYLFEELGFRGNRDEYYDPRNSFLNEVLSRRTGIPITLSLVTMEVGRRVGVPLVGVGMPGHFLVKHRAVSDLFLDPFNGGALLTVEECAQRFHEVTGAATWDPRFLAPLGNRDLLSRMLHNLKGIYLQRHDLPRALRTQDWLLALQPDALQEVRDRGLLHYRLRHYPQALSDLERYLASRPASPETSELQQLVDQLRRLVTN